MTIITILGMIGTTKPDGKGGFVLKSDRDKALYIADKDLRTVITPPKTVYTNMFPLLVDTFADKEIVAITTQKAKEIQEEVLVFENLTHPNITYKDINEKDFNGIFGTINEILAECEEAVIDLSHGYRHIPLLALISLIVNTLKYQDKIKHIIFAKDITPYKEYEIIDLIEYLDIATMSYILASFNNNYTVASDKNIKTPIYKDLISHLKKFSQHILANSLLTLFEKDLIESIIDEIKILEKDPKIATLEELLNGVKIHLIKIKSIKSNPEDHKRLFFLGEELLSKGYLLNAITILNEALPVYILDSLKPTNILKKDTKNYEQLSAIGSYIRKCDINPNLLRPDADLLFIANISVFEKLSKLQGKIKTTRNDLAHASGAKADDVEEEIKTLYKEFRSMIIDEDILQNIIYKNISRFEKYRIDRFEEYVLDKFLRLFGIPSPSPFQKLFNKERVEIIISKKDIPKEWQIRLPLTKKQEEFLELALSYQNTKKENIFSLKSKMEELYSYLDTIYKPRKF